MRLTEHRLLSFDGTPLFYRTAAPEGAVKARVYVAHGMGEHGGRYLHMAQILSDHGMEAVIADWRGFGRSGGPRVYAKSYQDYHEDFAAIQDFIEKTREPRPFFLLGHSFGGLLMASYAAKKPQAKGLILSSPLFGIYDEVPAWRHALGVAASFLAPRYAQKTNIRPEFLTHDPAVLSAYAQDTLIDHRISSRLYVEMLKLMNLRAQMAKKITCPVLILQAGEDRIIRLEKTRLFFEELASLDKRLEVFSGLYHEIFNEVDRRRIFEMVIEWIRGHII